MRRGQTLDVKSGVWRGVGGGLVQERLEVAEGRTRTGKKDQGYE